MPEGKDEELDRTLKEFGKCTLALCEVLHGDHPFKHYGITVH